jgi:exopolysaccharide biosynthesis polyprenyl glycosylphosphotransferase
MGQVESIRGSEGLHRNSRDEEADQIYAAPATARLIPGSETALSGERKKPPRPALPNPRLSTAPSRTSGPVPLLRKLAPAFATQISPSKLGILLVDIHVFFGLVATVCLLLNCRVDAYAFGAYTVLLFAILAQEGLYSSAESGSAPFLIGKASFWALLIVVLATQCKIKSLAETTLCAVANCCALAAWRHIWKKARGSGRHDGRNVLIVGDPADVQGVAAAIRSDKSSRRLVKALVPAGQLRHTGRAGTVSRIAREEHIDEVIIASRNSQRANELITECSRNSLDIVIAPETYGARVLAVEKVGSISLIKIQEQSAPEWKLAAKRTFDVLLAGIATLVTLPFMAAIAILIKLDSRGPVLYRSSRVGRKGHAFPCYKFRTMLPLSDEKKTDLRCCNDRQGAFFKLDHDPRVTRVGRWLRRYSLDELPQLWNVLLGDMSLVGPRPHPPDDVERYELDDLQRLDFMPGMTGLLQVVARKDPSFKRCVALDVEYIKNWGLLLDFKILAKTVPAVLGGSGA